MDTTNKIDTMGEVQEEEEEVIRDITRRGQRLDITLGEESKVEEEEEEQDRPGRRVPSVELNVRVANQKLQINVC